MKKTSYYIKELALIAENSPQRIELDAICHWPFNLNHITTSFDSY